MVLQDLVTQTKHLKVTVDATDKLQSIVAEVEGWEQDSCCLLGNVKSLFDTYHSTSTIDNHLSTKIEQLLRKIESSIEVGDYLCYNFKELPNLKTAAMSLQWCLTAISFCYRIPLLEVILPTLFCLWFAFNCTRSLSYYFLVIQLLVCNCMVASLFLIHAYLQLVCSNFECSNPMDLHHADNI